MGVGGSGVWMKREGFKGKAKENFLRIQGRCRKGREEGTERMTGDKAGGRK